MAGFSDDDFNLGQNMGNSGATSTHSVVCINGKCQEQILSCNGGNCKKSVNNNVNMNQVNQRMGGVFSMMGDPHHPWRNQHSQARSPQSSWKPFSSLRSFNPFLSMGQWFDGLFKKSSPPPERTRISKFPSISQTHRELEKWIFIMIFCHTDKTF